MNKMEINQEIANINTIWGIENMAPLSVKEEAISRDFLAGNISKEEMRKRMLETNEAEDEV